MDEIRLAHSLSLSLSWLFAHVHFGAYEFELSVPIWVTRANGRGSWIIIFREPAEPKSCLIYKSLVR